MTVETDAMNIALYASWLGKVLGVEKTQKIAQSEATNNSTIMPAAPTNIRAHLFGNAQAVEASTYGVGINTRNMMPISCTSPPKRRQANAWPHSWINFTSTKTHHRYNQLSGAIESAAAVLRRLHSGIKSEIVNVTTTSQPSAPHLLSSGRTTGIQRHKNRSGSQTGIRGNSTFIIRP